MEDELSRLICPPRAQVEQIGQARWQWRAPAKLNLSLAVLGLRPDGHHELDSIVAKVTLYDELTFWLRDDGLIELACSGAECGPAEKNLAMRAAHALRDAAGSRDLAGCGAEVQVRKHIPPGAGLGGGSSDAATTLLALRQLWELTLSDAELAALAAGLGSDVPLFLAGPASRMRGRGELLQPILLPPLHAVLYLSGLHCPTRQVYQAFDECGAGKAGQPGGLADKTRKNDAFDQLRPGEWDELCFNDLQPAAMRVCPDLTEIADRLTRLAGRQVHLTGSGSGLFVLIQSQAEAEQLVRRLPSSMRPNCRLVQANTF